MVDHFSQLTKRINTTIKPSEEEERSSGAIPLLAVRGPDIMAVKGQDDS